MTIVHIITLLITGIGVGFAGGLLGVGGAFIMTPVQYVIYTAIGIPTDMAIKLYGGYAPTKVDIESREMKIEITPERIARAKKAEKMMEENPTIPEEFIEEATE